MVSISENKKAQDNSGSYKKTAKEKIVEMLELPKDITLNLPKITMIGNRSILVENYEGIVAFDLNMVKLVTSSGRLAIVGSHLDIKEINVEEIMIIGHINQIEFINE